MAKHSGGGSQSGWDSLKDDAGGRNGSEAEWGRFYGDLLLNGLREKGIALRIKTPREQGERLKPRRIGEVEHLRGKEVGMMGTSAPGRKRRQAGKDPEGHI